MKIRIINQNEVQRLLPMADCMAVVSEALLALTSGEAMMPLRQVLWLPNSKSVFASMPSYYGPQNSIGIKVISVFPENEGTEFDSHQGAVLLFESSRGQLLAIMDASAITAIRTAAVSGVATRVLAREDAFDLAIIGSGVQAKTHLEAMLVARPIRSVRVFSKHFENANAFAEAQSNRMRVSILPCRTAEEAVKNAHIICTVTSSREPVLEHQWISSGSHINAVGAYGPSSRELVSKLVMSSRFFVDRRESALNEAGDFLIAKKEGLIHDSHIVAELGELLMGKVGGRTSREEITIFKSLGLAIEDLASAKYIYDQAVRTGAGTEVEFGGARQK